jgi:hypothetical protein
MKFQPSAQFQSVDASAYGWSAAFPLSRLTVTSQNKPNQPSTEQHRAHLSMLSDFLAKIPYEVKVTSGYRTPEVNKGAGGSATSQHTNGLAADVVPQGLTNRQLATWLYKNKDLFPELDQVIWYETTSHMHVGICPPGAKNCPRSSGPRQEFMVKTASGYKPWTPSSSELAEAARMVLQSPGFRAGGTLVAVGVGLLAVTGAAGAAWWYFGRRA